MTENKPSFKERMKQLTQKTSQVYIAIKNPQTPWYAKALGFLIIAYALSPIDLIPDFIPVIGYLDDLIILPLLVKLCIRLIPKDIWEKSEEEAKQIWANGKPVHWYYAIPIVVLWLFVIYWIVHLIIKH